MAGGKATPRQKMINLMYLVFIAMMALNMSKEVLSAFGLMNEKFEHTNLKSQESNDNLLQAMSMRAEDDPTRYKEPYDKALQVNKIANEFYAFLGTLKNDIVANVPKTEDGKLPYEQMDKGEPIDSGWFTGDKYSEKGNDIINRFAKFRQDIKAVVGSDVTYKFLVENLDAKFNTDDIVDSEGIKKQFLDYHYKGFPSIASLAKLSALQNDVREIEHEAYNIFMGNTLKQAASMKNYQAMVITDKSVYFAGEAIKAKVVLGRYDKSTVPTSVVVNGSNINLSNPNTFSDGQVQLNMTAGGLGEHKFTGKFTFIEDGKEIPVDILNSNYVVVERPNSATIAADKMNVVYMMLDNPISASFSGVSNDKVNVTASSGSLKKVGPGKYVLKPAAGKTVTITATGTLPDGKTVSDKKEFRIKQIPAPRGTVRGEPSAKGPVENLKISTIGARMEDFDFDVKVVTTGFTIIFPNNLGSVVVQGTKLNEEAQRKADRLRPGDIIRITDIKTRIEGSEMMVKRPSDATYQIL